MPSNLIAIIMTYSVRFERVNVGTVKTMFISRDCASALAIPDSTYLVCSFGGSALQTCQGYSSCTLRNSPIFMLRKDAGYWPMRLFAKLNPAILAP